MYFNENRLIGLIEMECGVWQIITILYVTLFAKKLLDSNFNSAVICKISNFNEIVPDFTFSQKSSFLKHNNWNFENQPRLLFKFEGSYMSGIYCFILNRC